MRSLPTSRMELSSELLPPDPAISDNEDNLAPKLGQDIPSPLYPSTTSQNCAPSYSRYVCKVLHQQKANSPGSVALTTPPRLSPSDWRVDTTANDAESDVRMMGSIEFDGIERVDSSYEYELLLKTGLTVVQRRDPVTKWPSTLQHQNETERVVRIGHWSLHRK